MSLVSRFVEVLLLRAVPGLINLVVLLFLGDWLSPQNYGVYSTAVATGGLLSSILFGPLMFGIISQYSKFKKNGQALTYEYSIVSLTIFIDAVCIIIAAMLAMLDIIPWAYSAPIITLGIYSTLLEIPHARLEYRSYGAISVMQSISFLLLAFFLVKPTRDPLLALHAFSISYALAAALTLLMVVKTKITVPNFELLKPTMQIGGEYTLSVALENGLYLGTRYVLIVFGSPQLLGCFSFCVDLAQRIIGFFLNVAGFAIVPIAFKNDAYGIRGGFGSTLVAGSTLALFVCIGAFISVLLIRQGGWVSSLESSIFEPVTFALVSSAVVFNRLKKMLIDPFAMRASRTKAITAGYAIGLSIVMPLSVVSLFMNIQNGVELTYLGAYITATVVTIVLLWDQLFARGNVV